MKKIALSGVVMGLKGEPTKDQNGQEIKLNELTANYIMSSKGDKSSIRKIAIAQAIYLNGDAELEDADYKLVKEAVLNSGGSTVFVGQILKAMGEKED